jgi:hypothetical protein
VEKDPILLAETRFALAQAVWESGGDGAHAVSLAATARKEYAAEHASSELGKVDAWLAAHKPRRKQP